MENATKALLIAGGVLIAIIIISVMVITFKKTGNISKTYDKTINQEDVTKFNENFTKYLNKELTIHQAITITNFAKENGVAIDGGVKVSEIEERTLKNRYKISISISDYNKEGYITRITLNKRQKGKNY